MSAVRVTILDYGMCNLLNVARAFEHCGADVSVVEDPAAARGAERLVVPGVGAFKDSMVEVRARGFDDAIREFARTSRPLLGICVGMQMLFEASEEFGEHAGLGILPGRVVAVPSRTTTGEPQRVPHIGWNHLVPSEIGRGWDGTLLARFVDARPAMYFVHSFAARPADSRDVLADCIYGGHRVCAAVARDNITAFQFHPERSGRDGLSVIETFLGR
jgi:imidazole glycerol-phosphate synthase subunit HisH